MQLSSCIKTGLKLKNSFTNKLEEFIPSQGNLVKWYSCGPTVYSSSHMGHARVLKYHFGYNVQFCMNVTDVDDKIIKDSAKEGIEYFQFARRWEEEFFKDMQILGVELPDYLTRVTEYIPEIIKFIEKICANGYAYPSKGSVYFDLEAFKSKFKYGKLKRVKEAETEEEETNENGEKKNISDFALWKASKVGEPVWDSPWGPGRPGWHIECSAMATEILGQKMDIHSGGIDLIFPHHENEIAQSEAHNMHEEWVRYFVHVGHLHVLGGKMSRREKNFITVKELLQKATVRVIKLYFFMHDYSTILNYNPETSLNEASKKDNRYKNLFNGLNALIRDYVIANPQKMESQDQNIDQMLEEFKIKVHEAFCNNIDTPKIIDEIDNSVKIVNTYIESKSAKIGILKKAYEVLMYPLKVLGLNYENEKAENSTSALERETQLITSIIKFRDIIKENVKSGDPKKLFEICDEYRDGEMVEFGVRVEDRKMGEPATWKYESKEILLKERKEKEEAKLKKINEKKAEEEAKLKKMSINPREMYLKDPKWAQFDQNGLPTHEKIKGEDKPINEKLKNKLLKEWNAQEALYQEYQKYSAVKQSEESSATKSEKKTGEAPPESG